MVNQRLVLVVVAAATVLLILGVTFIPFAMPTPRDVNNYGTVTVHSLYGDDGGLGPAISTGDTLNAEDGLAVVWRPDPNYSGELTCELYSSGTWYEDGNWNFNPYVDPYLHLWGFTLESVPQGTTEFYCAFGGQYTEDIGWTGSTIHFSVQSGEEPIYPPVEFTVEPEPESIAGGELLPLKWWLISESSATAVITVNDISETPRTITPSPDAQVFTYSFQEYTEGDYTVELTITPEYGDEVSSAVEVQVTSTTTTPTTTTDTDTTTTTDTDTTTITEDLPYGEEPDYLWAYLLIGIAGVAIMLYVKK